MSLKDCLDRIGIPEHESAILMGKTQDAMKKGSKEFEAASAALSEYAASLEVEAQDILQQVQAAQPTTQLNQSPSYKEASLIYNEARDTFLNVLPEDAEIEDVMETMDDFSPEMQNVFKQLDNNDWLGFDYPSQAINALFSEEQEMFEMSQGLKSAVGRLLNNGQTLNQSPTKQTNTPELNDIGMYSALLEVINALPLQQWKPDKNQKKQLSQLRKEQKESPAKEREAKIEALEEKLQASKPAKGGDILASIMKQPGIKSEEIKWTGLEELLTADPDAKFTKEDVQKYLSENGVNVQVTVADQESDGSDGELIWEESIWEDSEAWDGRVEDYLYEFDNDSETSWDFFDIDEWAASHTVAIRENIASSAPIDVQEKLEEAENIEDLQALYEEAGYDYEEEVRTLARDDFEVAATEAAENEYMSAPYMINHNERTDIYIFGNDDVGYQVTTGAIGGNGMSIVNNDEGIYSFGEAEIQAIDYAQENGMIESEGDENTAKWGEYVTEGDHSNYREEKLILPDIDPVYNNDVHFPDDNLLAFLRLTDRELTSQSIPPTPSTTSKSEGKTITGKPSYNVIVKGPSGNVIDMQSFDSEEARDNFLEEKKQTMRSNAEKKTSTFFIEEMQSDWHQQGRQEGYSTGQGINKLDSRIEEEERKAYEQWSHLITDEMEDLVGTKAAINNVASHLAMNNGDTDATISEFHIIDSGAIKTIKESISEEQLSIAKAHLTKAEKLEEDLKVEMNGVPNAPFKNDAWMQLALKRALLQAVDNGYNAFSWADSNVLSERWSDRYEKLYQNQYDGKMVSIVKKLTGVEPVHLTMDGEEHTHQELGYWTIPLTPELVSKIKQEKFSLFQKTNEEARGNIEVGEEMIINLFKNSDPSTFLHETAHLFLEMERKFAARYGLTDDMITLFEWLGADSFDDIDLGTTEGVEMHEKFARGFELYLREGNAPSHKLHAAFNSFKDWLKRIYQSVTQLDVEINDDIRQVFDRMLASEEEIALARNNPAYDQFFRSKEQLGMTDAQWEAYQKKIDKARERSKEDADTTLTAKLVEEVLNRRTKEWNAEKKPIIAEQKEILNNNPVNQIISNMRVEPMSEADVLEILGVDKIPNELKGKFGFGRLKKDGKDLQEYAEAYNYPSAKAMIKAIVAEPKVSVAAEIAAEAIMVEKYGDILNDGTIETEAREAVHNEHEAGLLLDQLNMMNKKARKQAIDRTQLKHRVEKMIASMKHSEIRPDQFYRQEVKAAQNAVKAETNETRLEFRTQQVLNHYLYKEASKVKLDVDKYRKYGKDKQTREYKSNEVADPFRANIQALAKLYDMRKKPEQIKEVEGLLNWYETQLNNENNFIKVELLDLNLIRALAAKKEGQLNTFELPKYDDLTVEDLRSHYVMLRHLRYVGGQMSDLEKAEFIAEKDDFIESVISKGGKDVKDVDEPGQYDNWKSGTKTFLTKMIHIRNLTRKLDGMEEDGAAYRNIYQLNEESSSKYLDLQKQMADRYRDELGELTTLNIGKRSNKETITKENGNTMTLSSEGRVMLALYWGTQSSREALMEGHKMTEQDAMKMMSLMTREELQLVNKIWKLNESLWPEISGLAMRLYGTSPAKVPATPFKVGDVEMTGGHMRLYYGSNSQELKSKEDTLIASAPMSMMKNGTMEERAGSGGKKVLLDKGNIIRSLGDNLHSLAYAENFKKVARMVNNRDFKAAVEQKHGKEFYSVLVATLQSEMGGTRDKEYNEILALASKAIRQAATFKHLGFSVRNTVQQFSSLPIAAQEVGTKDLMIEYGHFIASPEEYKQAINKMSSEMRSRAETVNAEAASQMNQISEDSTLNRAKELSFIMQTTIDSLIAYPVWMARYNQSMEKHGEHAKSVSEANSAVAESVGSGLDKNLGQLFQSGRGEFTRAMTVFGSWFNMYLNRIYRDYNRGDRRIDRELFYTAMTTPMISGVLAALLIMDFPEDEEDIIPWAMKTYGSFMIGTVPVAREIVSTYKGFTPKAPIGSGIEGLILLPQTLIKFAQGEATGTKTASNTLKGLSTVLPMPGAGQVARFLDYSDSYMEGNEGQTFNPYQALVKGKTR